MQIIVNELEYWLLLCISHHIEVFNKHMLISMYFMVQCIAVHYF